MGGECERDVRPVMDVVAELEMEGLSDELACVGGQGFKRGLTLSDGQLIGAGGQGDGSTVAAL